MPLSIDADAGNVMRRESKPIHRRPYFSTVDSTFILILLSMMSGILFLGLKNTTPNPPIRQRKVVQSKTVIPDLFYFAKPIPTFPFQYFKNSNDDDQSQSPSALKFASCLQLLFSISEISNFLKEEQQQLTTEKSPNPFILALKDIHRARQSSLYNLIDTGAALKVLQNSSPILTQDPSFLQPSYLLRFFFSEVESLRRKFLVSKEKIKLYPETAQKCTRVQFVSLVKSEYASAIKVPNIPISDLYLKYDRTEKILCLLHRYQLSKLSLEEANSNYLKGYSNEDIVLMVNDSTFPLQELKDLAALYQYGLNSCVGCFDENLFLLEVDDFQPITPMVFDLTNADTGNDVNSHLNNEKDSSDDSSDILIFSNSILKSTSSDKELSSFFVYPPDEVGVDQAVPLLPPLLLHHQQKKLIEVDDLHEPSITSALYTTENFVGAPGPKREDFLSGSDFCIGTPSPSASVSASVVKVSAFTLHDKPENGKDILSGDVDCKDKHPCIAEHLEVHNNGDYNGECIENYSDGGSKNTKKSSGDCDEYLEDRTSEYIGECIKDDGTDVKDVKDVKSIKFGKKKVTMETGTFTSTPSISSAYKTSPKSERLKKGKIYAESVEDCLERFLRPYVDHYSTTKTAYQNILAYSKYYLMTFDDYDTPILMSAITIKEREDFTRFTKSTIIGAHAPALIVDLVGIVLKKNQTTYVTITLLEDGFWNVYKGMDEKQCILDWTNVIEMITTTYRTSVIETLLYRNSSFE